jgi:creatinine amidohydrolase
MELRLAEMSWLDVEEVLKKPNAIILPVGAIEEHGLHLPLNVDSRIATYVSEHAAKKVMEENQISVLVAPCINYTETAGLGFALSGYVGTIGLSMDTIICSSKFELSPFSKFELSPWFV